MSRLKLTQRLLPVTAIILVTAMLAACNLSGPAGSEKEPVAERPGSIIRVALSPGDTPHLLAERYGARVLVWHDDAIGTGQLAVAAEDSPAAFALLGSPDSEIQDGLSPCRPDEPDRPLVACWEQNPPGQFLANAQRQDTSDWRGLSRRADDTIAGGRSTIWNEGRSTIWNDGDFHAFPENTDVWQRLGLDMAHHITFGTEPGAGVTVAVIDTGVDLEHPYLKRNLTHPETWLDLIDRDRYPQEEGDYEDSHSSAYGHGTVVAGIVLQMAPHARILPIRVLGEDGRGHVSDVVEAVHHAIQHGVDIINLSLGSTVRSEALNDVISLASSQGIFITMSAGNTGAQPTFPAAQASEQRLPGYSHRIAVTSVDNADTKSGFAAFGAAVGLAAPGESVWGPAPEELLAAWSGTSMAAPMAAGTLALALSHADGRLTTGSHELIHELSHSGADLYGDQNEEFSEWTELGHSRLHSWNFLNVVLDGAADK